MFKKKAVQVTFVDKPKTKKATDTTPAEDKILHPETISLIAERGKEVVKYAALAAVSVYAAVRTIDTLSQIAVKKTKSADKED